MYRHNRCAKILLWQKEITFRIKSINISGLCEPKIGIVVLFCSHPQLISSYIFAGQPCKLKM